jgi:hypothetical protein
MYGDGVYRGTNKCNKMEKWVNEWQCNEMKKENLMGRMLMLLLFMYAIRIG